MFNSPFYHYTLRKVVASFGSLFANIYVVKRDKDGKEVERLKVPLAYGPAERYIVRGQEDPDLSRNFAIKLPRMSFEIKQLEYDSDRKLNTIRRNIQPVPGEPSNVIRQYQGVPYKLTMELSIISKFIDDSNQIIEQILPWFTPAYSVSIKSIPKMNYSDDVSIVLAALNLQDNYEDDFTVRRDVIWTLTFEAKIMFYGPIFEKPVITKAITDITAATDLGGDLTLLEPLARVTTEPTPDNVTYVEEYGYVDTITDGVGKTVIINDDD